MHLVDLITPGDPDMVVRTAAEAARYGVQIGEKPFIARHIANAHTLFNVTNCLLFLPFLGLLAKVATKMVPAKRGEAALEFHLKYLDAKVLDTPDLALGQARLEVKRMAEVSHAMHHQAFEYFRTGDDALYHRVVQKEQLVDLPQKEITDFLTSLSQRAISGEASKEVADMLHVVADLERVGDHAENLAKLAYRMHRNRVKFSDAAVREIEDLFKAAQEFLGLVTGRMTERDGEILAQARVLEDKINRLEDSLRANHVRRLQGGTCGVEPGLIYIDMLTNLEKIGDHAYNVAEFLAGAR